MMTSQFLKSSSHSLKITLNGLKIIIPNNCAHLYQQGRQFHVSNEMNITNKDIYINPINDIQKHMEVPLLPKNNFVFKPSLQELKACEEIFTSKPGKGNVIRFVKSAVLDSHLPATAASYNMPEVAFIGRSNVGKSSLIKSMFSRAPDVDVKVSKKPGHTRTLNFYQVGRYFHLVDMPGYGFNMPDNFEISVENYIKNREQLVRTFLLIDGSVGITATDEIGINMLEEFSKPYAIILTKIDKVNDYKAIVNVMSVVERIEKKLSNICFPQPFLVSSQSLQGIPLLQTFIATITGNYNISHDA